MINPEDVANDLLAYRMMSGEGGMVSPALILRRTMALNAAANGPRPPARTPSILPQMPSLPALPAAPQFSDFGKTAAEMGSGAAYDGTTPDFSQFGVAEPLNR